MSKRDCIEIEASLGLVEYLSKMIWVAQSDRLKPKGIVMGATEFLKLSCEIAASQHRLPDIHRPEFHGLPIHIVPDSIITLCYDERDASRLSLGSVEDIARRMKQ